MQDLKHRAEDQAKGKSENIMMEQRKVCLCGLLTRSDRRDRERDNELGTRKGNRREAKQKQEWNGGRGETAAFCYQQQCFSTLFSCTFLRSISNELFAHNVGLCCLYT